MKASNTTKGKRTPTTDADIIAKEAAKNNPSESHDPFFAEPVDSIREGREQGLEVKADTTPDGDVTVTASGIIIQYGVYRRRAWSEYSHEDHEILIFPEDTCEAEFAWRTSE
jgi:hypothetical protein